MVRVVALLLASIGTVLALLSFVAVIPVGAMAVADVLILLSLALLPFIDRSSALHRDTRPR